MKNKYILGGLVAAMMTPALISCSSSYLDEEPLTSISAVTVSSSEEGAMAAVTGLVRQMQRQYDGLKNGNLNVSGETYLATIYGEGLGPDGNFTEITNYLRSGITPANFRLQNGWWAAWMYRYAYSIIGSANSILADIDEESSNSNQLWLKGSALTMRAHAYTRLMQVYGPRWADSDNGNKYALVLRLNAGEGNDHPFNTCNEIYDQLYSDLTEAIRCFEATEKKRGDDLFYVDENVARGIFARLAMLKNDYQTAQKMAHDARQNFPIMDAEDYLNGFSTETTETMWAPAQDPLGIYYWNFGPHYACNGHYSSGSWGYPSGMEYTLYKEMKATDVRSRLYFGPLTVEHSPELAEKYKITAEDFFVDSLYSAQTYMFSITGVGAKGNDKNVAMWDFIKAYGKTFADYRPEDIKGIWTNNTKGILFGVQYKFQGLPDGYTSCWVPYMRSAEMLLIEAEAACQNGDNATAQDCLAELMAKRDETYSFTGTGAELLAEIKLQRRIELWGEGFNWFDFKRWGDVIEFKIFDKKDMQNMGSFPKSVARTYQPDFMSGWRAAIPTNEFTYNKEADASLVGL